MKERAINASAVSEKVKDRGGGVLYMQDWPDRRVRALVRKRTKVGKTELVDVVVDLGVVVTIAGLGSFQAERSPCHVKVISHQ